MISLMGNCVSWMKRRNEPNHEVILAMLGLDNSGKTVTTLGLKGESLDSVAPTVGFQNSKFTFGKFNVTLFDLGGGKKIRGIWKNYYPEIHGAIYVLDSSDHDRLDDSKETLQEVLQDPFIAKKPILVLANKQDVDGAMDELDICEHFCLEELVNTHKCPCRLETCVAIKGQGKKLDKSIHSGVTWLLETIKQDYEKLNTRVTNDTKDVREKERQEKKEKRERYRKLKEERERLAAERGEIEEDNDDQDDFDGGDPFKTLDYEKLKAKEARLKEEKRKKKEEAKRKQSVEAVSDKNLRNSLEHHPPSPRLLSDRNQTSKQLTESEDDFILPNSRKRHSLSPKRSPHSSLERSPLSEANHNVYANGGHSIRDEDGEGDVLDKSPRLRGVLEPLDGGDLTEKKKKKKKKIKKNKTAPAPMSLDGDENDNIMQPVAAPRVPLSVPQGWKTPPEQRAKLSDLPSLKSSRLTPISEVSTNMSHSPRLAPLQNHFGPNMDNDDDIMT